VDSDFGNIDIANCEAPETEHAVFWPAGENDAHGNRFPSFTMYKRVDKKIRPVSTTFSPDYEVKRNIPEDPMKSLPELTAVMSPNGLETEDIFMEFLEMFIFGNS
jgi:hypothetical protein